MAMATAEMQEAEFGEVVPVERELESMVSELGNIWDNYIAGTRGGITIASRERKIRIFPSQSPGTINQQLLKVVMYGKGKIHGKRRQSMMLELGVRKEGGTLQRDRSVVPRLSRMQNIAAENRDEVPMPESSSGDNYEIWCQYLGEVEHLIRTGTIM